MPSTTTGAPVMRANRCGSRFFFQITAPVSASSAKTFAFKSPMYTANFRPTGATLGAVRTPPSALNVQCVQPVSASSAYTVPLSLPTNTRPATMAGLPYACVPPGKPKAHFSFSFGTSSAVIPGLGW